MSFNNDNSTARQAGDRYDNSTARQADGLGDGARQAGDRNDMTSGPILRKLLSLAAPMMGAQLVQMLYNMTDMFWLGRLGNAQVAASGAVGMYMWLSVSFMMIGSIGAGIGVSQSIGRGDRKQARAYAEAAIVISAALGALYGLTMIVFNRQMIGFFAFREQSVASDARVYLVIVSVAIPMTYLSSTISSIFTASGNSRVPFICNFIGMSLNIVLDPLLIFTFGLGIAGAAIATTIGQLVVCSMMLIMIKLYKHRPFETVRLVRLPVFENVKQIFRWAIPTFVEGFLFTFLAMITTRRVTFFGADAMAISRVGSQIESLTWLLGGAFGSALVTFIGQNYGASRWDRIGETFRMASFALIGYGALVAFIMAVPGIYIFKLFLPDPQLTEQSLAYVRVLALAQLPMCMEGVASNSFRGLGRTMPPAIVNTTCNILRVPLAYILSTTALGLTGVWIGVTISHVFKGIWSYIWYILAEIRRRRALQADVV